jgi:hypothetical protein
MLLTATKPGGWKLGEWRRVDICHVTSHSLCCQARPKQRSIPNWQDDILRSQCSHALARTIQRVHGQPLRRRDLALHPLHQDRRFGGAVGGRLAAAGVRRERPPVLRVGVWAPASVCCLTCTPASSATCGATGNCTAGSLDVDRGGLWRKLETVPGVVCAEGALLRFRRIGEGASLNCYR